MKTYIQVREPSWAYKENRHLKKMIRQEKRAAFKKAWAEKVRTVQEQSVERALARRQNPTPSEKVFADILLDLKVEFKREYVHFLNKFNYRIIDFYLPNHKLNIEIDGGYHNDPDVKKYDEMKDKKSMFFTLRIPNQRLAEHNFKEWIRQYLSNRAESLRK